MTMDPDEWDEREYDWRKVDDQYMRLTGRNVFHDVRVYKYDYNESEYTTIVSACQQATTQCITSISSSCEFRTKTLIPHIIQDINRILFFFLSFIKYTKYIFIARLTLRIYLLVRIVCGLEVFTIGTMMRMMRIRAMKRSKAMSTKIIRSLRAKVKMTTTIRLKKKMMTGELRIKYLLAN